MRLIWALIAISVVGVADTAIAESKKKSALDGDPDLFALVTPDRLLGKMTRRRWLDLYPVNGREYWAAWDCKNKPCDTKGRAHIRTGAKLIPRTDRDPKPIPDSAQSSASSGN